MAIPPGVYEDADRIAFEVIEGFVMPSPEKDFAAVVPFPIADCRRSRDSAFLPDAH